MDAMAPNTRVGLQMQLNLNPAFVMDNDGYTSTFNSTFSRPQTAAKTDKVYFRKRDEMTYYADALVRWNRSFADGPKQAEPKKK